MAPNFQMIAAVQKDRDLLRDIASRRPDPEKFDIWWFGHGGFLLAWNGKHLLFDPYLSNSYSDRGSRTTELVVDPARLVMIDVVTAGNVRGDHLDPATWSALREVNPAMRLVLPWAGFDSASAAFVGGSAPELIGMDEGSTAQVGDFRFHGISAALGQVRRDNEGRCDSSGRIPSALSGQRLGRARSDRSVDNHGVHLSSGNRKGRD